MFAINRRLVVTLFLIAFFMVGLWAYDGFQVREAKAHGIRCLFHGHTKIGPRTSTLKKEKTGQTRKKDTTCARRACTVPNKHTQTEYKYYKLKITSYYKKKGGGHCHTHNDRFTENKWKTEWCNRGSGSGG